MLSTANRRREDQGSTACTWEAGSCPWSSPLALPLSSPLPVSVVRLPALRPSPTCTKFAVHRKDEIQADRTPLHQIQNSKPRISQQYTVISRNSSKRKRHGSHPKTACSNKSKSKPSYQEVGYLVISQESSGTSKLFLEKIEERILRHKNLNVRSFFQNGIKNCIEITRRDPDVSNPLLSGPYHAARAVIMEDGVYCFQVHHQKKAHFLTKKDTSSALNLKLFWTVLPLNTECAMGYLLKNTQTCQRISTSVSKVKLSTQHHFIE